MAETCTPEQLQMFKQAIDDRITNLESLAELGYEIDPIEDIDIASTINSLKKLKADKIKEAKEAAETVNPVGLINSGKIRAGNRVGVEVLRWVTKNGRDEYTVKFDGYVRKVAAITIDDMNPRDYVNKHSNGLGSAVDMKKKLRNLDKEYVDLGKKFWKNQDAQLELFDKMVVNEGGKTTHTEQLREVLEKITDPQNSYLNEFKVYMKESAEKNGGIAVAYETGKAGQIVLDIKEGSTANPNEMSAAEVYVHEMVHMAVETALTYKQGPLAGVISELMTIHEHARENITPEQIGQKMWDYIFKDENALSEFIAHSMTNEKLMKLLGDMKLPTKKERNLNSTSWFDKMIYQVIKLYDLLRELVLEQRKEKTMDARIGYLATRMMEHNNMSKEVTWLDDKLRFISKSRELANLKIVDGIAGVAKFSGEAFDMMHKYAGDGVIGNTFAVADTVMAAINPWPTERQRIEWELTRKNLNKIFASIGMDQTFAPEGQITKLWEHIRNKDDGLKQKIEHYLLMNQQIDRKREDTIGTIAGKVAADLKGVSKSEMTSVTRAVLEIDMKSLSGDYTIEQMRKMLESDANVDAELDAEYTKLDKILRENPKASTFYKSQAKGLGYYMATGVSGKAVYKNANRIMNSGAVMFNLLNTDGGMKDAKKVEQIIDRMATIEGIRYSSKTDRDTVAKIMESHEDGISNIMYLQAQIEHKNRYLAAKNKTYNYPDKGEIKEIIPSYMNTRVNFDDAETEKAMKKLGFKKVGESGAASIAVYMRPIADLGEFDKQAVAKISMGKRLHSIDTMHNLTGQDIAVETQEAIEKIAKDARKEMLELANEIKLPTMDGFNMQVVNGEIVNYGVSISKETMETSLKQKKRVDEVIGKMFAETQEKEMAQQLNNMVWDEIVRDQVANYSRREDMTYKKEYIEIGPNAKHETEGAREYAQTVWDNMPQDMRAKVRKLGKDKQYIAVRRDLTDLYFGRRAPSLLRTKIPFMNVTAEDQLRKVGAGFIADGLMLAGEMWQEMIALQKIDIVLRTPGVIIGNIMSNINLSIALGQSPWAALLQTINMTKSTKQYLDNERKLRRLVLDYRLERDSDKKVKLKRSIDSIKSDLKESPVYDLMKAGMFTTIMEDVNTKDLVQKSRLEEKIGKYTDHIPKMIKDTASALWVTEDTKLFQALAMTVQYSDFVARANRYHVLLSKGMSKQEAMKYVIDEQGNYGINLGGFMTWIDKMGGWRFPKYTVIANKVMIQRAKTDPIATATLAFTGVESPINAVALFKNWDYALLNPVESAWDLTAKHIIPPTALEYVGLIK